MKPEQILIIAGILLILVGAVGANSTDYLRDVTSQDGEGFINANGIGILTYDAPALSSTIKLNVEDISYSLTQGYSLSLLAPELFFAKVKQAQVYLEIYDPVKGWITRRKVYELQAEDTITQGSRIPITWRLYGLEANKTYDIRFRLEYYHDPGILTTERNDVTYSEVVKVNT